MNDPKPFASELVMQPIGDGEHDVDGEANRYFLWTAISRVGGRLEISRDEFCTFLAGPYNATLHWDVDPTTGDMTMVANRGEPVPRTVPEVDRDRPRWLARFNGWLETDSNRMEAEIESDWAAKFPDTPRSSVGWWRRKQMTFLWAFKKALKENQHDR